MRPAMRWRRHRPRHGRECPRGLGGRVTPSSGDRRRADPDDAKGGLPARGPASELGRTQPDSGSRTSARFRRRGRRWSALAGHLETAADVGGAQATSDPPARGGQDIFQNAGGVMRGADARARRRAPFGGTGARVAARFSRVRPPRPATSQARRVRFASGGRRPPRRVCRGETGATGHAAPAVVVRRAAARAGGGFASRPPRGATRPGGSGLAAVGGL